MSMAKRLLQEIEDAEAALWDPLVVQLTADEIAWFADHPEEPEMFRARRPGEFDALAEQEDLMGVTVVPIGDGLARIYPEARWRFSDE
jgi:hypothetical protein